MFTVIPYDMNCKSWKSILCTCYVKHIIQVLQITFLQILSMSIDHMS